jgi:hypothetical protein
MSSLAGATSAHTTVERDFHAWLLEQAALLRKKRFNQLDWSNIAEELEAMASAERRELLRRLATIFEHFLKMEYEPEVRRERGRKTTIAKTRTGIEQILEQSPRLKGQLEEFAQRAYGDGCRHAGTDLGLTRRQWEKTFSRTSPWTVKQILDDDFFPSPPKGK